MTKLCSDKHLNMSLACLQSCLQQKTSIRQKWQHQASVIQHWAILADLCLLKWPWFFTWKPQTLATRPSSRTRSAKPCISWETNRHDQSSLSALIGTGERRREIRRTGPTFNSFFSRSDHQPTITISTPASARPDHGIGTDVVLYQKLSKIPQCDTSGQKPIIASPGDSPAESRGLIVVSWYLMRLPKLKLSMLHSHDLYWIPDVWCSLMTRSSWLRISSLILRSWSMEDHYSKNWMNIKASRTMCWKCNIELEQTSMLVRTTSTMSREPSFNRQ